MSASSTRSLASKQVTRKPWFLTSNDGEVFAWKDGVRLKLRNGQSAGRVRAIAVLCDKEKTVTVSICCVNYSYSKILAHHMLL